MPRNDETDQTLPGSISKQIGRLREREDEASEVLWTRFFPRLVALARHRLKDRQDAAFDEEDVALNAFASFCRGVAEGRFDKLENRDDIWQVLLMIMTRKMIDERRRANRAKRGGARTVSLDSGDADGANEMDQLFSDEPTPELATIMAEQFRGLLDHLQDQDLKEIALAKMEGYTDEEIAQRRGCARRTIVRKLRVIRELWENEAGFP